MAIKTTQRTKRTATRTAEELWELFCAVHQDWEARRDSEVGWVAGVGAYIAVAGFDSLQKVQTMQQMYRHCLSDRPDLAQSDGVDLGCWFGFSTAALASLGCRRVYGIDIREHFAQEAEAWRRRYEVHNLRFRAMREGTIPLLSASVDWILINQVLCNALPDSFDGSLREAFRILRPGGRLVLSDANNPHCDAALDRLRQNFRRAEIGEGSWERPDGPNYRARCRMIAATAPGLGEDEIQRLARETCYLYGDQVRKAARVFQTEGRTPASVFDPDSLRPTCIAGDGASNGNLTDPFELSAILESIGFAPPAIACSPVPSAPPDNDALWEQLGASQGFFIFADKPHSP